MKKDALQYVNGLIQTQFQKENAMSDLEKGMGYLNMINDPIFLLSQYDQVYLSETMNKNIKPTSNTFTNSIIQKYSSNSSNSINPSNVIKVNSDPKANPYINMFDIPTKHDPLNYYRFFINMKSLVKVYKENCLEMRFNNFDENSLGWRSGVILISMLKTHFKIAAFFPMDWVYWGWLFNNKEIMEANTSSIPYTLVDIKQMPKNTPLDSLGHLEKKINISLEKSFKILKDGLIFRPKYNDIVNRDDIYSAYDGNVELGSSARISITDKLKKKDEGSIYKDEPISMDSYGFLAVHRH